MRRRESRNRSKIGKVQTPAMECKYKILQHSCKTNYAICLETWTMTKKQHKMGEKSSKEFSLKVGKGVQHLQQTK